MWTLSKSKLAFVLASSHGLVWTLSSIQVFFTWLADCIAWDFVYLLKIAFPTEKESITNICLRVDRRADLNNSLPTGPAIGRQKCILFGGTPCIISTFLKKKFKIPEISNAPAYEEECTQENVWFNSLIKVYDTASTHRSQPAIHNCCRLLQISNNQTWQTSRVFEG